MKENKFRWKGDRKFKWHKPFKWEKKEPYWYTKDFIGNLTK